MIGENGEHIYCDGPRCSEKIKNHRWGRTKAERWFFGRDDKLAYCPAHIPVWVQE